MACVFDLHALRETQGKIQNSRAHLGQTQSQAGYQHLAAAFQSDFRDKAALQAALEKFLQAARFQRSSPEPLIGLGYIFLLLNQLDQAEKYLREALRLSPQDPDAAALLRDLHRLRTPDLPAATPLTPTLSLSEPAVTGVLSAEESGPDAVQHRIATVLTAAKAWALPPPSPDSARAEGLTQQLALFQQQYQTLQSEIQALQSDWDTTPLELALYPLEKILRQGQKRLELCQLYGQLVARMHKLQSQVETALAAVFRAEAAQLPIYESRLERVMDSCDQLADEIEALQDRHPTAELEAVYHELLQRVEQFRDCLDERN